jgi:hypothetical protein
MRRKPNKKPVSSKRRTVDARRFEEPGVEVAQNFKIPAGASPIDTNIEDDDLEEFFAPEYGGSE